MYTNTVATATEPAALAWFRMWLSVTTTQLHVWERAEMDFNIHQCHPALTGLGISLSTCEYACSLLPSLSTYLPLSFPPFFFPSFFPSFLPHLRAFLIFFRSPLVMVDIFEPRYYQVFLLLRYHQALQTSTKLWAFSQFTHRFIICWHCFSINRSTFTDTIDSTASLLTNSLFNVSNLPQYFT